jgi:hypothetical protein
MGADAYEKGTEALVRFMDTPDCNGADLRVVAEEIADLERTIALFDPSQTPSIRNQMLAHQDQARERHTSLAFALADGALKNGCLDAADHAYRRIISYYTGSAYSGIRDRAKLGVDDVRAARGRRRADGSSSRSTTTIPSLGGEMSMGPSATRAMRQRRCSASSRAARAIRCTGRTGSASKSSRRKNLGPSDRDAVSPRASL